MALTVLIDEPGTEMVNSVIPRDVGVEVASALVEDWEWVGIILPCIDWSVLPPDKMYRQLTRERRIELLSVIGYHRLQQIRHEKVTNNPPSFVNIVSLFHTSADRSDITTMQVIVSDKEVSPSSIRLSSPFQSPASVYPSIPVASASPTD